MHVISSKVIKDKSLNQETKKKKTKKKLKSAVHWQRSKFSISNHGVHRVHVITNKEL